LLAFILCTDAKYLTWFLKWFPVRQTWSVTHVTLELLDLFSQPTQNPPLPFSGTFTEFLRKQCKSVHETYWITAADPRWSFALFRLPFMIHLLLHFWCVTRRTCLGNCTRCRSGEGRWGASPHLPPPIDADYVIGILPLIDSICFNKLHY